ncbi:MAG TPA: hypothetical protein ENH24_01335 [Nitrospirae bacterium]|nr:hypothetical protein [Nitrospirota bacterium]
MKKLSAGDEEKLREIIDLETPDLAVVDISDASVRLALSFLEKIGAVNFKARLGSAVSSGQVLITEKESFLSSGGIVVQRSHGIEGRAWSIVEQLFAQLKKGSGSARLFRDAFSGFRKNRPDFDLASYGADLGILITELDAGSGEVSNEGGVKFNKSAFETMMDVSDVTLEDCRKAGVLNDIKYVFTKVIEHDMQEAEKEGKSVPDKVPFRIEIVRLSDSMLPTVISMEDGTIRINENFVKIMYKLAQIGLREKANGGIYDTTKKLNDESRYLGNFYFSVLYSIALHEIRGHFRIKDGMAGFNPDEKYAQGERGRKYRIVNLLAIMYFWFGIIEDMEEEEDNKFINDGIKRFIDDHPELFRGLSLEKDDMEKFERFVIDMDYRFNQMEVLQKMMDIKRIPIPAYDEKPAADMAEPAEISPDLSVVGKKSSSASIVIFRALTEGNITATAGDIAEMVTTAGFHPEAAEDAGRD